MGNILWRSGNEAADKVKDKTLEDEADAGKQSDQPEEELTSPKRTAMENVHHGETNVDKVSPPHNSTTLETTTAPPQSISTRVMDPALKLEQSDAAMETDDTKAVLDAGELFLEIYGEKMIPQEVKPKWKEFGYELGFRAGELQTIDDNGSRTAVEKCALQMLENWRLQLQAEDDDDDNTAYDILIKALEEIEQNAYAAQLKHALKSDKIKEYTDAKIAKDVASYWDDLGIQLRVKHLDGISTINNPTEYKFKALLRQWLKRHPYSNKKDVFDKIHDALINMEMIAAAEKFSKKAYNIN